MKASELRIGNLVIKSLKSGIGRKIEAKIGYVDIARIFEGTGSFNYEPTPITEEWLVRFGFEDSDNTGDFINDGLHLIITNDGKFISPEIYKSPELEHFHQLQNLYFALTGDELKYD